MNDNNELLVEIAKLKQINFLLEEKVRTLTEALFGKKSEKTKIDEGPSLFDEAEYIINTNKEPPVETETVTYVRKKPKKGGRKPIPDHFPRTEVVLDIPEEEKVCACGCQMEKISEECSEKLDIIPAKIEVVRTIRPKYACKSCDGVESEGIHPAVKIAPVKPSVLPKTICSSSLLAYILINKFCDGLPFYRQEKLFSRIGIEINRGSMARWSVSAYENIKDFFGLMKDELLKSYMIGIDETRVQVLKEDGKTAESQSYMWVYRGVRDKKVVILFQYDRSRSGYVPDQFLSEYKGAIQTDGYGGYNLIAKSPDITRYGCWAHARRRFVVANDKTTYGEIAGRFVGLINKLYHEERILRESESPPGRITKVRIDICLPVLHEIKSLANEYRDKVLPSSNLSKAIEYMLGEWPTLEKYIYDGNITIDNNLVENSIRPFVVGRKNWLFYDSPEGAEASACFYSLIETAKANGIEPYSYLYYIFDEIPKCKDNTELEKLTPANIDRSKIKPYEIRR